VAPYPPAYEGLAEGEESIVALGLGRLLVQFVDRSFGARWILCPGLKIYYFAPQEDNSIFCHSEPVIPYIRRIAVIAQGEESIDEQHLILLPVRFVLIPQAL